jgi:hypothetical protein
VCLRGWKDAKLSVAVSDWWVGFAKSLFVQPLMCLTNCTSASRSLKTHRCWMHLDHLGALKFGISRLAAIFSCTKLVHPPIHPSAQRSSAVPKVRQRNSPFPRIFNAFLPSHDARPASAKLAILLLMRWAQSRPAIRAMFMFVQKRMMGDGADVGGLWENLFWARLQGGFGNSHTKFSLRTG